MPQEVSRLTDRAGFRDDGCGLGGWGGRSRACSRKLGGAAQIPDQGPAADDGDEGEEDDEDAEAGFHGNRMGSGLALDAGGERAVGLVTERQGVAGRDELELGVIR